MMKFKVFFLLVFFLTPQAEALSKDYMFHAWNYTTKEVISAVSVGDVDGDGRADAVVSSSSEGMIRVFDGRGRVLWEYLIPAYVFTAVAEDFDSDGRSEVAVGAGSYLYFLNESGELLWKYHVGRNHVRVISVVKAGGGRVKKILLSAYSQECSDSDVLLLNANGDREWSYSTDYPVPYALDSEDLDADGNEEVLVGFIDRSKDTVRKLCVPAYKNPSYVLALDEFGKKIWDFKTGGAVNYLLSQDLDGDWFPEILVGGTPDLYMLNSKGTLLWNTSTVSRVDVITAADLNGDGKLEVIFGSNKVYALNSKGKTIWVGDTSDRVYVLASADLNKDNTTEVIAGSDALYVYSNDGIPQYKSNILLTAGRLGVGDLSGDGLSDVIVGAVKEVILYETGFAAKKQTADAFRELAKDYHRRGENSSALEYARKARATYLDLGDLSAVSEMVSLIDLIEGRRNVSNETSFTPTSSTVTPATTPQPAKLSDAFSAVKSLILKINPDLFREYKGATVFALVGVAALVLVLCVVYLTGKTMDGLYHHMKTPKIEDALKSERKKEDAPGEGQRSLKEGMKKGIPTRPGIKIN